MKLEILLSPSVCGRSLSLGFLVDGSFNLHFCTFLTAGGDAG